METASPETELRTYRFIAEVTAFLRHANDAEGAIRFALRAAMQHFQADEGALAVRVAGKGEAELAFRLPRASGWQAAPFHEFLNSRNPRLPRNTLMAGIPRKGRPWAALALRRTRRDFEQGTGRDLARGCARVAELVQAMDRERLLEVQDRIDRKILGQLDPKDLAYQILHGLRSLTGYDHSSAVFMMEPGSRLTLVAEQIAWSKGKSTRIGISIPAGPDLLAALRSGEVAGFDRAESGWSCWKGDGADALPALLEYNAESDAPREGTILCAPLWDRDGLAAVLKVSARQPGLLGAYEAGQLDRFLPRVAVAIRNAQRAEVLGARVLEGERKNAVANLARAVAHDVNNALGAMVPLLQQLREEAAAGRINPETLKTDLEHLETSVATCRRIFGGMRAFARGGARELGVASTRRALETTFHVLADSLTRARILFEITAERRLPLVTGRQGDLEQLFLNLIGNARDAMPGGGRIEILCAGSPTIVEVNIRDSGPGIPPELLSRIEEPFYTTKPDGTGLGIPVCRSILAELGGELVLRPAPGHGTEALVRLRTAASGELEPQ